MAIRDIKLDANNQLILQDFDLVIHSGIDRVVQAVRTKLKTFQSEWFNDTTFGTPWFQSIIQASPRSDAVYNFLKQSILDVPEVTAITKFNFNFDGRTRTVTTEIGIKALGQEGQIAEVIVL